MRRLGFASAALALVFAIAMPSTSQARGLKLGVMDFGIFDGADSTAWYGRTRDAGASMVRLTVHWASLAPTRPANPRDPSDPRYDWRRIDAAVQGAVTHGLTPFITAQSAPAWAEGPNRPASAPWASWRPDPAAYADFMEALARRYDGTTQPRVRLWQPWNEPNLPTYLTPQWTGKGPRAKAASPAWYRRLLNGAYARIKAVHADNLVVAAGTAPYGDAPQYDNRMTPVRFLRELLSSRVAPAKLDAIDHHPYATGSATSHALLPENVAIPDLYKLVDVLKAARKRHTVAPAGRKRVWVTEVSWDSNPPDPNGVPEATRIAWLQDTFYSLWRQGADTICWFLLKDQPPTPSYDATYQSGLYLEDGTAKAAVPAFRLPIVIRRSGGRRTIWGHAPASARVSIERKSGSTWRAIATFKPRGGVYQGRVKAPRGAMLRARQGTYVGVARRTP
jgi:hypothetical protein